MDVNIYLVLATVAVVTLYLWFRRHDPKLPPLPAIPMPIFGHLFYMGTNPRPMFKQWRKKCGNIYSLYMGQSLVVVLNGYDLLKEALVKNADKFSDRPYILFDAVAGVVGKGVAFSSGDLWKENRAATANILRNLGMGKNIMAEKISDIVAATNQAIANLNGQPADLYDIINTGITNVVCSIMIGHTFQHDDADFRKVCRYMRMNFEDVDARNLANYFPFLLYLPGDYFRARRATERAQYIMYSFFEPFIKDKANICIDEHDITDFVSGYIYYKNKKAKAGESTKYLDDINLRKDIYDLFSGGMDTASNTLYWGLLYLLHYPDVQENLYREIEEKLGTENQISMSDSSHLPYLNAFIKELQRVVSVAPLGLMHVCSESTTLAGYTIPKGTHIFASLDSIMYDKTIWGEDIHVLRPDRFLDEQGKVKNPEEFVPFSLGKRACVAESVAKMELFLFLSWMIQRFKFLPSEPSSLPPLNIQYGITTKPYPFKVRAIVRKSAQCS